MEICNVLVSWGYHNKSHRLSGLNNSHLFSHRSVGWKSEIRTPAWLGSGEISVLGLQMAAFSWFVPMDSLCTCAREDRNSANSLMSLLIRMPVVSDESSTLRTSFTSNPNHLFKSPTSLIVTQERGELHVNFADTVQSIESTNLACILEWLTSLRNLGMPLW